MHVCYKTLKARGQGFHLQGNFPAKGNFGLCKEKGKEIKFTRKWQGNLSLDKEIGRKS
jgi:hypothetical protein